MQRSWLIEKDSDVEKDQGQEEKGTTEDEMIGRHHRLDGHGFGWDSRSWWWTGWPGVLRFIGSQSWTWLSDWPELNWKFNIGLNWTELIYWTEYFYFLKFLFRNISSPHYAILWSPLAIYSVLFPQCILLMILYLSLDITHSGWQIPLG